MPFRNCFRAFCVRFCVQGQSFCMHVSPTYSRIAAISEAFKIVNTNVLEAEQRKQLQAIRAHLDSLEDGGSTLEQMKGGTPNVIDV